ncbi:MAG TPA: response regulator [Falsiroseomonas sp.]|jgi:two-component system chemotaxis response regulator CheY|nr:response regulator [Falsiroseomonas sp.]
MSEPEDNAAPRHCLVVDDSRVVRKAARRFMEGFGFTVREAADGQEALTACRDLLPEIVLLDWNMPVMDGLSFLKAARAEFDAEHPVIMLCTTEIAMERIMAALEAGAQEYVVVREELGFRARRAVLRAVEAPAR